MGLTFSAGPLSPHAPKTVNYRLDGPAHKLLMHPYPRRIRAVVDGRTVIDTVDAVLVHETALPPRLYVPESDIDDASFVASDHSTHCPFKGDASYRSLQVGDRTFDNALWAYPDPVDTAPWLAGYASLYWEAADAWFDEDEQIAGITDPFHRVDVRSSSRHVQVLAGDVVVAESTSPMMVAETGLPLRWYLSPDDVRVPLEPTATRTHCPYKGDSSYWSVRLPDGREITDAAWGYEKPLAESTRIAGRLAFLHEDLQTLVDGKPA